MIKSDSHFISNEKRGKSNDKDGIRSSIREINKDDLWHIKDDSKMALVAYYTSLVVIFCAIISCYNLVIEGATTSESHEQVVNISTVNPEANVVELNKEISNGTKRLTRDVYSNEAHFMDLGYQSHNLHSLNDYDETNRDMPERYSLLNNGKQLLVPSEKLKKFQNNDEKNGQGGKNLDGYDHKYRIVIDTLDPPEPGSTFGPFPDLPDLTIDGEKILLDKKMEYILKTPENGNNKTNNNGSKNKIKQRIKSNNAAQKISGLKQKYPARKKSKLRKPHSLQDSDDDINPIPYGSYHKNDNKNLDESIIEDIVNKILKKVHKTPEFEVCFGKSLPGKISLGSTNPERHVLNKNLQQFLKWVVEKPDEYRHESNLKMY